MYIIYVMYAFMYINACFYIHRLSTKISPNYVGTSLVGRPRTPETLLINFFYIKL